MFSGIIESLGTVKKLVPEGTNLHIEIKSDLSPQLYIDQSIAHNGVCLTVVDIQNDSYIVTAIKETLDKTNLGNLKIGSLVNLERSLQAGGRMDGHFVQGHVDAIALCKNIQDLDGSWFYTFTIPEKFKNLIVQKGSVCINGVSLTVVDPDAIEFSVAIIPYTYEHTNFKNIKMGDTVNIEFDILGKYIIQYMENLRLNG